MASISLSFYLIVLGMGLNFAIFYIELLKYYQIGKS
jgi:Na+-transporting methylmalonyl-CoA/oxaloacetate decarboxylase gamma subunit